MLQKVSTTKSIKADRIIYREGSHFLDLDQVIALYEASTLGERRPVNNRDVMQGMLDHADIMITAWSGELLVGISRALTDYTFVAYLADLAVHVDFQKQGIGTELIEQTRRLLKPTCLITLLASPIADDYYPKIGFIHHPRAWNLAPEVDPSGDAEEEVSEGE